MKTVNSIVLALSVAALSASSFQNHITKVETKVMQLAAMPGGGVRNPYGCLKASMPGGGVRNPYGCLKG